MLSSAIAGVLEPIELTARWHSGGEGLTMQQGIDEHITSKA